MRIRGGNEGAETRADWVPVWSSLLLEQAVERLLSKPDSRVGDLLHGLWTLLEETRAPLTRPMSHFLRDITVLCFTRYRARYADEDFVWVSGLVQGGCSAAQAYLALHSLPQAFLPVCREGLLAALTETEHAAEAQEMLAT